MNLLTVITVFVGLLTGFLVKGQTMFTFSRLVPTVPVVTVAPPATTMRPVGPLYNTSYGYIYPYSYNGNSNGQQQQVFG